MRSSQRKWQWNECICKTAVPSVPNVLTEWQYLLSNLAEYILSNVSPDNGNTPTQVSKMQCSEYQPRNKPRNRVIP